MSEQFEHVRLEIVNGVAWLEFARPPVNAFNRPMVDETFAAMKQALEQLVASCHGDDDPHCAIIDGLAGGSRAVPDVAPEALRKARRGSRVPAQGPRPASEASTSHVDLMAWTHGLHRHA